MEHGNQAELMSKVISAVQAVDEVVMQSKHIKMTILGREHDDRVVPFDYSNPDAYLQDVGNVTFWNEYFGHLLSEWDADHLSEAMLTWNIERLTASASTLDNHGTALVQLYRRLRPVPEATIQGVLGRHASLNAFLNSAQLSLEHWWKSEGLLSQRTLRRRRHVPHMDEEKEEQEKQQDNDKKPNIKSTGTDAVEKPSDITSVVNIISRGGRQLTSSNATLIGLTLLVTMTAASLQILSFRDAVEEGKFRGGSSSDSDFYATLQTYAMQLLGLYHTVLPALRSTRVRRSYALWSWALALGSFVSATLSVAYYFESVAWSQLLGFIGSSLQTGITLQLIWIVDDNVKREESGEKDL